MRPLTRSDRFFLLLLFLLCRLHLTQLVLQLLYRRLRVLIGMVERGAVVYFLQSI